MSDITEVYRAGNNVVTDAYRVGIEEGRKRGYDEQARDHHQWLLNADERLAEVARVAVRLALMDAADAWESSTRDALKDLAEKHYEAGGPSMPTIWLRLRADANLPTTTADPERAALAEGSDA